ncbi:ABC-2 transporter permease [Faecalicatena contorta]|uniref:ABC-2 transporter permease n=1 Tax=Faecalicatena contorta TaxID=39482 RepID=UPI001F39C18D|nr:ABC-2 transporter permease [Faecalicatena contorta]MCF2682582.1 ABC-2 transporter permease [Faecalicatena contorta]
MKGLLIKDFKLLKNQKQFFIVIGLITLMFMATNDNPYFTITYATMMFSMFTMSTISYDEYDNGAAYLFSLPISRKGYVGEKYVFGVLTSLLAWLIVTVLNFVFVIVRKLEIEPQELGVVSVVALVVAGMVLAISIPLQLKFGAEKSRMAFFAVFALAFVVAFIFVKVMERTSVNFTAILEKLDQASFGSMTAILLLIGAVMLGISALISMRVMDRKEF